MKKIIIAMCAAATMLFTGCEWDETATLSAANSAGSIAMLTWFSIDDPDEEVKQVLKEVVTGITTATVQVAEGKTYLDSILPQIQELVLKTKLNDYQKTLVNAGSVVMLNGIDTFLATNKKVKDNAELVSKVVSAFGRGCLVVLNMKDDCPECQYAKKVYATRSMTCRGGKFVAPAKK